MAIVDQGVLREDVGDRWDPVYMSVVPLPAALMLATLLSDFLYWVSSAPFWTRASVYLLSAALASGMFAAGQSLLIYLSAGRPRPSRTCWIHVVGHLLALLLSLSNLIYRLNEDPGRAVVPAGIGLTAIALFLLAGTARLGRDATGWDYGDAAWDYSDDIELD